MDVQSRDVRVSSTFSSPETIRQPQSPPLPLQHSQYHSGQQQPHLPTDRQPSQRQPRARPNELLERQYAGPPTPLNQLQHRSSSKMSLFHLFSKPKVEKARGHIESAHNSMRDSTGFRTNGPRPQAPQRYDSAVFDKINESPSALPQRSRPTPTTRSSTTRQPPHAADRKIAQWEAPPLFQAYPQATKSGILHIDAVSSAQQKQSQTPARSTDVDNRVSSVLEDPAIAHLPKKIFVLVTSGYLLQYADTGPSDRRPERIMQLRQNSAAFACDLVQGMRYVLQVSQIVDSEGAVVVNSKSIFHKLGIRGATAKRETSKFVLIMSGAIEFEEWMNAVRAQIEALGGRKARPETAIQQTTAAAAIDLRKAPSQSHRYQIKRHPSKISIMSPSVSTVNSPDSERPPVPPQAEKDTTDATTVADFELEPAQIRLDGPTSPVKMPEDVGRLSTTSSSTARSTEPPLPDSLHSSQRISTTTTVATTVANSPENSPTSSPTADPSPLSSSEASYQKALAEALCRKPSSEAHRTSSVMPSMYEKPLPTPTRAQQEQLESPKLSTSFATASPYFPLINPVRRLSAVNSASDTTTLSDIRVQRESKMSLLLAQVQEGPHSIADLSPSSTWVPERVSGQRASFILATSQPSNLRLSIHGSGDQAGQSKPRRISARPFSLPLRINPTLPTSNLPVRQEIRSSRHMSQEEVSSPVAAVHTLSAIVDPKNTIQIAPSAVPLRASSIAIPRDTHSHRNRSITTNRSPTSPTQLSLYPSVTSPTASAFLPTSPHAKGVHAVYAVTSPTQQAVAVQQHAQAQLLLRRPVSLQIRSDHAPFLRNLRSSTHGLPPSALATSPSTSRPIPIRNLKPSRSSTSFPTQPGNAFASDDFGPSLARIASAPLLSPSLPSRLESVQESDIPKPLPSTSPRMSSYIPPQSSQQLQLINPRSSFRTSRRMTPRAILPHIEFGVPVVGLGPPAPPPNVPLPSLPPAAPSGLVTPLPAMSGPAGLGISI